MPQKPVDRPITVVVGPLLDDTDGKTPETNIAYDEAGMDIDLIVESHDESVAITPITPTSSGANDWLPLASPNTRGYYKLEITVGQNEDTGTMRVVGKCNGVRSFSSVAYDVIRQHEFDARVSGTTNARIVADTEMTGRTSQTVFRLTAGSSDDDFYLGHRCIIYDAGGVYAVASGTVVGYVGSTKEVTLDALSSIDPFTTANGDVVIIEAVPVSVTVTSPHARGEMDDNSTQLSSLIAYASALDGKVDILGTKADIIIVDTGTTLPASLNTISVDLANVLTDTSATLPGLLSTIDGVVDSIRVDTNESIPAELTTILVNVMNTLLDTGQTLPATLSVIQAQTDKLPTTLTMQLMYDDLITVGSVIASPTPTTTAFACDLTETTNNHFKDLVIGFVAGPLKGQTAQILSYDGGSKLLTMTSAMTDAPAVGNTFVLLGLVK